VTEFHPRCWQFVHYLTTAGTDTPSGIALEPHTA